MFSRRTAHERTHNRLTVALERARARGEPLLDLTLSNPTLAGIPYSPEVTRAVLEAPGVERYEPLPFGLAGARAAVSELWSERGSSVPAEHVAMTASTSEAYAFAFKLLCDPGEEVLVPAPSYPLFEHLAVLEGVRLVPYRLGYDGAWFVDAAAVAARVTPATRAILTVSPNNPTGSYLRKDDLARLAGLGLPIVSDEVFAEYPLADDPGRARSALETDAVLVIALDGLSKLAALPHWKLAWMSFGGPRPLVDEALARLELVLDTFLSPSTPIQRALPELIRTRHVAQNAIRARLRANLDVLTAACRDSALSVLRAEGGWYAVLRLPATHTDEDYALSFLERGVLVQPGYFFEFGDDPHVVVSLLTPEPTLRAGIARIVESVDETT
ncbi:MAG TPA: pyridoxal phosphate-dependent aminotransferase [Polyangiaceae bacterium]